MIRGCRECQGGQGCRGGQGVSGSAGGSGVWGWSGVQGGVLRGDSKGCLPRTPYVPRPLCLHRPSSKGGAEPDPEPPPRSLAPQPTLTRPWPCRSLPPWQGGPGPPHSCATGHSPPVGGVCSSICPPQHPHPKRGSSPNPGGLEPRGVAPRFTALVCHRFRSRKRRFLAESERRCGAPSELFAPPSRVEFNEPVSCLPLPVTPRPPPRDASCPPCPMATASAGLLQRWGSERTRESGA